MTLHHALQAALKQGNMQRSLQQKSSRHMVGRAVWHQLLEEEDALLLAGERQRLASLLRQNPQRCALLLLVDLPGRIRCCWRC